MSNRPLALVIEDNPDIAEIVSISLDYAGYDTEIFSDGDAAVDALATRTPYLITLDLNLPSRNGLQVLQFIRAEARIATTWVILNTANATQADFINQIDDPYLFTMIKPVSSVQIMDIARRLRLASEPKS